MARSTDWTRSETLAAFHIYLQLPFGQLHRSQPRIVQLSQWLGRTASAVAMKLVNLASLDPQIVASGRRGMGNASKLDKHIWDEFLAANDPIISEAAAFFGHYAAKNGWPPYVDVMDEIPDIEEGKTSLAIVQVRVNQARFRRAILASYNATCCMSGLRVPKLLVASHIMPWSMDAKNRLNPSNGLCLSALHDRAYDLGLMSVLPDLTIRVSKDLKDTTADAFTRDTLASCDGRAITLPERFRPAPDFLAAHAERFGYL
jgi:putative restriction endonuclease